MSITFEKTFFEGHKVGKDKDGNEYVRIKFRRQYYGEIQCGLCGADLMVGIYWINTGSCVPHCSKCVEDKS